MFDFSISVITLKFQIFSTHHYIFMNMFSISSTLYIVVITMDFVDLVQKIEAILGIPKRNDFYVEK
jgi:hypothetical protein